MGSCGIQTTHLKTMLICCFSGMDLSRVDQDHPTRRSEMFCAQACKRLATSLDQADDIIVVTVAWIGMLDMISTQKPYVEFCIMPGLRPFICLHAAFVP